MKASELVLNALASDTPGQVVKTWKGAELDHVASFLRAWTNLGGAMEALLGVVLIEASSRFFEDRRAREE